MRLTRQSTPYLLSIRHTTRVHGSPRPATPPRRKIRRTSRCHRLLRASRSRALVDLPGPLPFGPEWVFARGSPPPVCQRAERVGDRRGLAVQDRTLLGASRSRSEHLCPSDVEVTSPRPEARHAGMLFGASRRHAARYGRCPARPGRPTNSHGRFERVGRVLRVNALLPCRPFHPQEKTDGELHQTHGAGRRSTALRGCSRSCYRR